MDLSLSSPMTSNEQQQLVGSSSGSIEKEHMFDKVVTPSDVGKLNRLVIPKQYAERYFPLDSSTNEKGLLLNFEDRNGTPWRFRYSYWNSSQSYVMTKGWSRFVKDKKLNAGDVVSFQRGLRESFRDRLFIDWRRRPPVPDPTPFTHFHRQNNEICFRWGRLYSLPPQFIHSPIPIPRQYDHLHALNPSFHHNPFNRQHWYIPPPPPPPQEQPSVSYGRAGMEPGIDVECYQTQMDRQVQGVEGGFTMTTSPVVYESVPLHVLRNNTVATPGKRLRLFGVNMECCPYEEGDEVDAQYQNHSLPNTTTTQFMSTMQADNYSKKGKSSLSFNLDP